MLIWRWFWIWSFLDSDLLTSKDVYERSDTLYVRTLEWESHFCQPIMALAQFAFDGNFIQHIFYWNIQFEFLIFRNELLSDKSTQCWQKDKIFSMSSLLLPHIPNLVHRHINSTIIEVKYSMYLCLHTYTLYNLPFCMPFTECILPNAVGNMA